MKALYCALKMVDHIHIQTGIFWLQTEVRWRHYLSSKRYSALGTPGMLARVFVANLQIKENQNSVLHTAQDWFPDLVCDQRLSAARN